MASTSLPNGIYAKYKHATQFFLDWLLRAHDHGQTGMSAGDVTLDGFENVVRAIAQAPATQLSPSLLHQLPRALAACQVAITLRERVTQYFADVGAADARHAHFLTLLKTWSTLLHQNNAIAPQKQAKHPEGLEFTNYYDVLRLPDDYFTEDTSEEVIPMVSESTRRKLFDEAFKRMWRWKLCVS